MHGSSEAVALAARTPGQVTLPPRRSNATPEERAGRPIDQPQRILRILHLAVAGAEGLRKIPGPTAAHQGPSCPRCAGPTVHAPLAEITLRG